MTRGGDDRWQFTTSTIASALRHSRERCWAVAAACWPAATVREAYGRRLSERLSPAPSDRAEGRRAHRRGLRRHQPRRLDAGAARRRAALSRRLEARSDRRHRHRRAAPAPPNAGRRQRGLREIHSILAAAGVPPHARARARLSAGRPGKLATHQAQLRARSWPKPARAACGRNDLGPTAGPDLSAKTAHYWNLGCATQRNLAAMVDNPADLVQPRGEGPAYTPRRTVALDKYRKGESTSDRLSAIRTTARSATSENDQSTRSKSQRLTRRCRPRLPARDEHIAPAPRVSIQAFCETVETAAAVQAAGEDRRLAKAHLKIQMGGMTAARRSLSHLADAERHHHRIRKPRRRHPGRPRSRSPKSATPAPA